MRATCLLARAGFRRRKKQISVVRVSTGQVGQRAASILHNHPVFDQEQQKIPAIDGSLANLGRHGSLGNFVGINAE